MTATVTAAEARAEAVRRLQGRARPAEFRTVLGPDGGTIRVQVDGGAGTGFLAATTVGEFADDVIARTASGPVGDAVATIMTAAQSGAPAAAAAVCKVRALREHDQFTVWTFLDRLSSPLPDVTRVLQEVRAEWARLDLPVRQPSRAAFPPEAMDRNRLPDPGRIKYPTPLGFPA
jgi:hypothetical protein